MFQMKKKKTIAILVVALLCISVLGGCGSKSQSKGKKTIKKFLDAAVETDYTEAAKYATDDTMENLGWNDMDAETMAETFYSSLGVSEEGIATLKADEEVASAVDQLVKKMSCEVLEYKIDTDSYELDDTTAKYKVSVTIISADQLSEIFTSMQSDIDEQAATIGAELAGDSDSDEEDSDSDEDSDTDSSNSGSGSKKSNSDSTKSGSDDDEDTEDEDTEDEDTDDSETSEDMTDEEMKIQVIARLIPEIIPSVVEKIDAQEGVTEDWIIWVDTTEDKVSGVYEAE